ncbi:mycofactocin system transcriptional regulator [Microbacterium sp. X-17]|uniref:mycofactocin system transcriptional regulator n=1 Tax=Microbacterium sp. X-17 TaxID=3144404 RepID=UPI0031F5167C
MSDTGPKPAPPSKRPRRNGRAKVTSRAELSRVGLELFIERGFDEVTIPDIAAAAGIGRRTFFRYFPSKNDLPWGDFDLLVKEMGQHLATVPDDEPLIDAISAAVITFNTFPDDELPFHRDRMNLLFTVPMLTAHSALRYQAWRDVIAEFAAKRLDHPASSIVPQTIGWAFLAASLVGYEQWLKDPGSSLTDTLISAHRVLRQLGQY